MRTVAIWIRKIPMRKDMPCGVVNLCQGRSLEREEVTYSKRLSMSVEPRSMPKRFNNSRKEKKTMAIPRGHQYHILLENSDKRYAHTSGASDLHEIPKLRTSHSDERNYTNDT